MPRALMPEPEERMTREEYRAWTKQQQSHRFERIEGVVVAMAAERAAHNLRKGSARDALRATVQRAGLPSQVFGDGMTIEVGDSDYEPDAVVRCGGDRLPADAMAVPDPLVIVEVLSPTTSGVDRGLNLRDYFRLPSLQHYLIVWP
jgi:Uma2 family endonuclease